MDPNSVSESDVANWLEGTTHTVECAIGWFGLNISTGDLVEILHANGLRQCAACNWWWYGGGSDDDDGGGDDIEEEDGDGDDDLWGDGERLSGPQLCFQCQDRGVD